MAKKLQNTPTARKAPEGQAVVAKIITEYKDRNRAEIRKWRQGLELANNPVTPRQHILQDLYDNLESDGHFIAQRNLRTAATLSNEFSIIDLKTGKEIPEKTELFKREWFHNFILDALSFIFKGDTILELIDPATMRFELIPRRNIVPNAPFILLEVNGDKGIDISTGFERNLVVIRKKNHFGVMADICGQLIWKRNAQQSWAEFSEKFGQPLITATTNKTTQTDIDKIDSMLGALGEAARAVLPEGTTIDIKPFAGSDAYKVYDMQIARINDEISKPIVGGNMITDDGSSRSQSEVHERNLDKISWMDKQLMEFVVNGQLLGIMQAWGWNINPETDKFVYEYSDELPLKELYEIVHQVNEHYEVDMDWIAKKFSIPITGERKREFMPTASGGSFSANFR
jgi:hypothetical protein